MATTYEHIAQNKRRTWLLVLLFPITFALLTWVFCLPIFFFHEIGGKEGIPVTYHQPEGRYKTVEVSIAEYPAVEEWLPAANQTMLWVLPICWGLAMLWILISYYTGDKILLHGARAFPIDKEFQPEIYRLVENLCISRGLPVPQIYIIDDDSLNAFATGRDPEHASMALTKGIVLKLERAELEGVIAHELAHIENRDIRLMLITVAGISFFTFMGEVFFRLGAATGRSKSDKLALAGGLFFVLAVIFVIYGYLIAPLIRLAISRTREYQADATAALTTRNPGALASALSKISGDCRVEVLDSHASMAPMCIESPLSKIGGGVFGWLSGLWDTHPPIRERIAALLEMDRGGAVYEEL